MMDLASWVTPQMLKALGWTLLHFLWQGTAVAALLAAALAIFRSAQLRYLLALAALVLMAVAPAITFIELHRPALPVVQSAVGDVPIAPQMLTQNAPVPADSVALQIASQVKQSTMMLWMVQAWLLGVALLSLRTAGGLLQVARMRRHEIRPLTDELYRSCLALQKAMGLERLIRYGASHQLDAPAVLGWFRPVVVLTARAVTGLTPGQLQAVIAHELAHIRRFDTFVNLFQVAVETVLFYHPAVWWVSQKIRIEREVCCDHEALAVCGNAAPYARALTLMEAWRAAPSISMAINRSPLAERIQRLLGVNTAFSPTRVAGLGASLLFLVTALLAGRTLLGVAYASLDQEPFSNPPARSEPIVRVSVTRTPVDEHAWQANTSPDTPKQAVTKAVPTQKPSKTPQPPIRANPAVGKERTASYLDAIHAAGFAQPDVHDIIAMKMQGITPDDIREIQTLYPDVTPRELIALKIQAVAPQYVRELRAAGLEPGIRELIGMKMQGITLQYVRALQAAGFEDLDSNDLMRAKMQDITPEFIGWAGEHGFRNLTLDQLIALKRTNTL